MHHTGPLFAAVVRVLLVVVVLLNVARTAHTAHSRSLMMMMIPAATATAPVLFIARFRF